MIDIYYYYRYITLSHKWHKSDGTGASAAVANASGDDFDSVLFIFFHLFSDIVSKFYRPRYPRMRRFFKKSR